MNPLLPESAQRDLVLASKSPRRRDLLERMGFVFRVDPPKEGAERAPRGLEPGHLAEVFARNKRDDIAARRPGDLVVGADTIVVVDGEILSKPKDDRQAGDFLEKLSGRSHDVITAVAVARRSLGVDEAASETTRVTFRRLLPGEIDAYIRTGEGRDKAGSYAAQGVGSGLIHSIDGCFYNVVGLPIALLLGLLRRADVAKGE